MRRHSLLWYFPFGLVLAGAIALTAALLLSRPSKETPQPTEPEVLIGAPVRTGTLQLPAGSEPSGIVASPARPDRFWVHDDSGHPPVLYAVDATGRRIGQVTLAGVRNTDWEDIAADPDGRLYVGDFGDNAARRTVLSIHVVPEPEPRAEGEVPVLRTVSFRYPPGHGPVDCEAMVIRDGRAYLVTKEHTIARVYRVDLSAPEGATVQAEWMGTLPEATWVTAADITSDGRRLAVLSYSAIWVYDLPEPLERLGRPTNLAGTSRQAHALPVRPRRRHVNLGQAEGVCWTPGPTGANLLVINEQGEMYRLPVTAPPTAR